jgi:hypothetical protein
MNKLTVLLGYDPPTCIVGRAIAWFTWGHKSHAKVAFIWPDGDAQIVESRSDCGVIERAPEPDGRDRLTDWHVVDLPRPGAAWKFAWQQLGKGYDVPVWKFIRRPTHQSRIASGRWYCSELCYQTCIEGGLYMLRCAESWKIAPSWLYASPLQSGPVIPPWRI